MQPAGKFTAPSWAPLRSNHVATVWFDGAE